MMDLLSTPAAAQWKKVGPRHHHGIALPLFSLHSEQSTGIGEYPDLIPLIEWCKRAHMDVIQLLPLNDTGEDKSPYNAISAFALNPLYLGLSALPLVENVPNYRDKLSEMQKLTKSASVLYSQVRELKTAFLKIYFEKCFPALGNSEEYKAFTEKHPWLERYALFKAIKESQNWSSWESWPLNLKSPSEASLQALHHEYKQGIDYHSFVQYLCFMQCKQVKEKADREGIFLKGDIPILISRDSADVWSARHFFLLQFSAGAPPDMYAKEGQNWGFPVYDWDALEKHDYHFWRERLKVASELYHLYRIDHVVGFFRIWAIPKGRKGVEGFFLPQDQNAWIPQGEKILKMMLETAPLLPIGEDLGTIPPEVRECLKRLGICGTKVMRWERNWNGDGGYIPLQDYEPISMTTASTHDSDTLQLWWRHAPKEAKLYCHYKDWDFKPILSLERHREILYDSHHSSSLLHINLLQEYLALFPDLVSEHPSQERINLPGTLLESNWTYRLRPSIEKLLSHDQLLMTIKNLVS